MFNKRMMMRYLILLLFTIIPFTQKISAQQLSAEDLLSLQLPPLDSLFEGARRSSMVEFYGYRMSGQELALKTERRSWLEYVTIFGTYQYGVMGINSFTNLGSNYPIVYQNTGGEQLWYNIGAALNIPLNKVFDRRNRIKTQQLKIQETMKEREMWYDQQRVLIVELYIKAQGMLKVLKIVLEQSNLANAQFDLSQKDFMMGAINAQGLSSAKGTQVQAFMQLENVRQELNTAILKLEVLASTKIINK